MPEKVAVVGSREGADLGAVSEWLVALFAKYPDTILVSGGAQGVDKHAETTWLSLGGRVISLRPRQRDPENYIIERWELGGGYPAQVYTLEGHPTLYDYRSAAIYRDTLIADEADRTVSFQCYGGSRGAGFTASWSEEALGRPTYRYEAEEIAA